MKKVTLLAVLLACSCWLSAQNNELEALRKEYPLLVERFSNEIENQRADYIFLVDISGTMGKFSGVVVPALQDFFKSLKKDDFVSVIKFGGEAANDIGSQGKISDETVNALTNYSNILYNKPVTDSERKRFFLYTDLANMLNYLADDMRQIGRNQLKFVFIITDFMHDPSPERKGKEDWGSIKTRFVNEQNENDVYMFAMMLPGNGSGRDLDKVEAVMPQNFNFSAVNIPDQQALSDWFTNKKNGILLDKFTSIIRKKNTPLHIAVQPDVEQNGDVTADVTWEKNELFSKITFNDVSLLEKTLLFDPSFPVDVETANDHIKLGTIKAANAWTTLFTSVDAKINIRYQKYSEFLRELTKLGIVEPDETISFTCNRRLFLFALPLWLTILLAIALVTYLCLFFMTVMKNANPKSKISGTFRVEKDGSAIAEKKVKNSNCVDIGRNGKTIPLEANDCNWRIKISVKRFVPLLLKKPTVVATLTTGASMKIAGRSYKPLKNARFSKDQRISTENGSITIFWKK